MKVLLVSENRCRDNLVPWPIGPAWVAASAVAAGHEVHGLDLMFSDDPEADVAAAVRGLEPDCVGISIRNIDNQEMHSNEFFLPAARSVVEAVRSATDAPLVLGGSGFTIFPLECLDYLDVDLGIVGEGEGPFVSLLDALEDGPADPRDLSGIPGLARRGAAGRRVPPPERSGGYFGLFPPDRDAFGVERYDWVPGRDLPFVTSVQSRRGCSMHCIYCSSPTVEGRVVRCREPRSVADELESLEKEHGLQAVVFADSNFNHPASYAKELCGEIARRRLSLRWTCSVNPHWFDPSLFEPMRKAGCAGVSLGNESGSQTTLDALRKDFTAGDVRSCAKAVRRQGMQLFCFLLLGGPAETRDTVEESVALMDEVGADSVRVTAGIRIFPGCELERIALEAGSIKAGQNLLYPAFYLEDAVAPWLYDYMREVCAEREGWVM